MGTPKGKIRIDVNDIIGKCLGKLEVVSYKGSKYDPTKAGEKMRHYYMCDCKCGKSKMIRRSSLLNDKVHSCGCRRKKV